MDQLYLNFCHRYLYLDLILVWYLLNLFFLVFHGGGGFTFSDVYNLPLHIRRMYVSNLVKIKKSEQEQITKANSKVRR
jgi:hypothetical protein